MELLLAVLERTTAKVDIGDHVEVERHAGRSSPSDVIRAGLPLLPRDPASPRVYGNERLEGRLCRGVAARAVSYRDIDSIL